MAKVYLSNKLLKQKPWAKLAGWLLLICLLAACAIPLRQSPEPAQQAAGDGDNSTSLQLERRQDADLVNAESASDGTDDEQAIAATASSEDSVAETNKADDSDSETDQSTVAQSSTVNSGSASSAGGSDAAVVPLALATFAVEQLDLAVQEQTFLEAISSLRRSLTEVNLHKYVEVTDDGGTMWQGELLQDAEQTIVLMQPRQSGGQSAVQLISPAAEFSGSNLDADLAAILSAVETPQSLSGEYGLPDVEIQFVRARETDPGLWSFDVRLNHPDTGWEDYTDGWHVETLDGEILGVRILAHPHVNEMPFTRSQGGIRIPADVEEVQVRSHDLVSGYAAEIVIVPLGESGEGEGYEVVKQ